MSSLHTKYRPTLFKHVLGQETVVKSLRSQIEKREAHTFLLVGPSGTGKTTLARICANKLGAAGPDIMEIDAATFNGVDDMRGITRNAQYHSIGAGSKVHIIDECHQLSKQAWSALLKATEEPPEHAFWFFCTTDGNKVPKTMQTRSLSYTLKPVGEALLLELLRRVCQDESINLDAEILTLIAEESMGSPRQALAYLAACETAESIKEAKQLMEKAGEEAEVIALCRYLMDGSKPKDWPGITRRLELLKDQSGEGIRQVLVAYMTKVALKATTAKRAMLPLRVLDAFERPCNTSDKIEPIMLGLAKVFIMGRPQ